MLAHAGVLAAASWPRPDLGRILLLFLVLDRSGHQIAVALRDMIIFVLTFDTQVGLEKGNMCRRYGLHYLGCPW
jgi:hypothetical protein